MDGWMEKDQTFSMARIPLEREDISRLYSVGMN